MKRFNLFSGVLLVCAILFPAFAQGAVILDLSPQVLGPPSTGAINRWSGQHFLQRATFAGGATVTGMAIYADPAFLPVNTPTRIDIYDTNGNGDPGSSQYQFTTTVNTVDNEGAIPGLARAYSAFSAPITMAPGEVLWFSMSGYNADLAISLTDETTTPNSVYYFNVNGNAAGYRIGNTMIRLYGSVPEPASLAGVCLALTALVRRRRAIA